MKKVASFPLILGIAFFIAGMIFVSVGVAVHISDANFKESALTTTGTIIDIRSSTDSDGDTDYDVVVEFIVKGQRYSGKLNYYFSSMDEGDTLTIYYNPDNPNDFMGENSVTGLIILIIFGGVFALIGLGFVISGFMSKAKRKRVLGYNFIIKANISSFDLNTRLTVNGKHPYILTATIMSPYDGLMYTFKSDSIWTDLTLIIENYNIKTVPVYVNPQNYKEYYVDLDYFKQYLGQ